MQTDQHAEAREWGMSRVHHSVALSKFSLETPAQTGLAHVEAVA